MLMLLSSCAIGSRTSLKLALSFDTFFTMPSCTALERSSSLLVSDLIVSGVAVNLGGYCGGFEYFEDAMLMDVIGLTEGSRRGEKWVVRRPMRDPMRVIATVRKRMARATRKRDLYEPLRGLVVSARFDIGRVLYKVR